MFVYLLKHLRNWFCLTSMVVVHLFPWKQFVLKSWTFLLHCFQYLFRCIGLNCLQKLGRMSGKCFLLEIKAKTLFCNGLSHTGKLEEFQSGFGHRCLQFQTSIGAFFTLTRIGRPTITYISPSSKGTGNNWKWKRISVSWSASQRCVFEKLIQIWGHIL